MGLFVAGKLFHKAGEGSGGGSDPHNKGWYATLSALQEAYPTAEAGDYAIVGATDTVWIWDTDTSAWVDSDQKGQVTSVNNQTGDVTVQETLVSGTNIKTINNQSLLGSGNITIDGDFVPQLDTLPTAGASNVGDIVQYIGTTDANYTNGYFYESTASYSDPSATISQTTGSGLTDLAVNVDTFIATEQPTQSESVVFTAIVTTDSATYTTVTGSFTLVGGNLRGVFESYGWTFGPAEHNGVIVFNNSQDCYIGPEVGTMWVGTNVGVLELYGIQITGTPAAGDVVQYSYTDGSTSWTKGGEAVNPADYGVSYSGVPNNGDALTVVYTAPAVSGYAWEQKDVQPAPEVGIDWKTSVDLPGTFKPSDWNIAPVFKINGGLPDGNYEFYYKMKVGNELYGSEYVPGEVTFKYIIKIENDYISGIFAPIIDGNCIGSTSKGRAPVNSEGIYLFGWKDGNNNMYLYTDNSAWWASDVHGYWASTDVPNCFRLSAIKNLATGQEYIAEGSLYNDESLGTSIQSHLLVYAIQQSPNIPSSFYGNSFNITELPTTQTLQCTGITCYNGIWGSSTELTASLECGSDKFCARLQTFIDDYVLTIYEATGIFEDAQFIKTSSGVLYVKLNLPAGASGTIYAQYGLKDMSTDSPAAFYMQDITGQSYTALVPLKIGVTPVANYIGKILQYDGTTDANYTNGYFYKATGNIVNVPGSVDCTETTSLGKTITMDIDGFINYMVSATGYSKSTIEGWLNNSNFVYNVNDDFINWSPWGNLPNTSDVLQYITFSPAAQSGEYITWTISNYVAAHTEVQNAAWTEVKTQQSSTTPSTMPTLVVANWSSNTQTVTVQGVTASNNVIVSPAPASAADYASAGIVCTAQGANSLTFTCTQTPSNDITVNVAIL